MNKDVLKEIFGDKKSYKGLSRIEAESRLKIFGFNSRPKSKNKTWFNRLAHIITEPMMLIILVTAVVYYFIGEPVEAGIFFAAIIPISLMEYVQEKRTDETVEALDKMMVDKTKVYRDNRLTDLEIKYLVPGDMVYLTAGDKVPADGYIFQSPGFSVDESMLTGESNPVSKLEIPEQLSKISDKNILRKGTLITQGEGLFFVEATGLHTEYGRLGSLLEEIKKESTPLQKKIYRLVRGIAVVALLTASAVTVFLSFRSGWREGLLGGLTMAMSLIPEEFPVVFSVFLIMGVWRMAKKNALVRQMAMVETLGSATVICTDKTGTLTEGRMSLKKFYFKGAWLDVEDKKIDKKNFLEACRFALLSFERNAVDPMEIEMQSFYKSLGLNVEEFFESYEILTESPFNAETKMVHHVWREKKSGLAEQYSVGAPEAIMEICKMGVEEKKEVTEVYENLSGKGYRVVALANLNKVTDSKISQKDLKFVGLIFMSDPPREGVKEAVEMCQEAGIRILMITGDNKMVAKSIAEQVGIKQSGQEVVNGSDLAKLSPSALEKIVATHNIFSRVKPEHKFYIVEALKRNKEIVAMTGDGVNDAPALKRADIGIAMGMKGTEVAREAAGIILMDDKFPTIAEAVKGGRRIYHNMRQAFVFLISFHLPIVGLAIIPLFFHQNLVFLPIHIIFLELICDPASVLGFERDRAPRGIMKNPPRPIDEPLINMTLWKQAIIQGVGIFLVSFSFYYYYGLYLGDIATGRTMSFCSLVFSQILLIFFTREWSQIKSNRLLIAISFITILALTFILFNSTLRNLFYLVQIDTPHYLALLLVSLFGVSLTSFLAVKRKIYG